MRIFLFLAAAAAILAGSAAAAENCPPLQLYTRVQMIPRADGRAEFVPVFVAGRRQMFLLDTGSPFTMIQKSAADTLGVPLRTAPVVAITATYGRSNQYIEAPMAIGDLRGPAVKFMVMPDLLSAHGSFDGILGSDILGKFDIGIDFDHHTLDLISQDHCPGRTVYWPERPIAVVDFDFDSSGHIAFKVKLDGKEIPAILDTGATHSALSSFLARRRFDVTIGDADTPVTGKLNNDQNLDVGTHRFGLLEFQNIQVRDIDITIIPDVVSPHFGSDTPLLGAPRTTADERETLGMIVGMDVLRRLHLYIACKEKKLYITPASQPATVH